MHKLLKGLITTQMTCATTNIFKKIFKIKKDPQYLELCGLQIKRKYSTTGQCINTYNLMDLLT